MHRPNQGARTPGPTELPGTERWAACTTQWYLHIQALQDSTARFFPADSDESPAEHTGPLCQGPQEPTHQALLQPLLLLPVPWQCSLTGSRPPFVEFPWASPLPWLQTLTQCPGTSIQGQGHPQAIAFHSTWMLIWGLHF